MRVIIATVVDNDAHTAEGLSDRLGRLDIQCHVLVAWAMATLIRVIGFRFDRRSRQYRWYEIEGACL